MKPIDYTPIERNKKYKGKFLAVEEKGSKVKVIAFGSDPEKVLNEARTKGCKMPLLTRVPAKKSRTVVFYNEM